jgi:putative CocE/NonD family hydrolase
MNEAFGTLGIRTEEGAPVPMRDGVILRANIFWPDAEGRFPALVHRTPYGKFTSGVEEFVRAGYVVVSQDTRGRYASDGEYTLSTQEDTGDAEDGYDTVEWAAAQAWCNGKVGTFGNSYAAWMQYQLAKLRPPHLLAMSAVSIPTELTEVDWPGAFKVARRLHWWFTSIAPDLRRRKGLAPPHTPSEAVGIWNELEQGRMIGLLPWSRVVRYLPSPLAEHVCDWLENPGRRAWKFTEAHKTIEVPNLDFTGYYDHCCGINQLTGMQQNAASERARTQTRVVIGPWNHRNFGQRKLGDFDFGSNAEVSVRQLQIRWFDCWLKGIDNGTDKEPPVRYFVMGSGTWKSARTWPPDHLERMEFYLSSSGNAHRAEAQGSLTREMPKGAPSDSYTSDPFDPVPTLWDREWFYAVSDRRRLYYRQDILRYSTEPLDEDMEIAGNPEVALYASSSAPDTDLFVRLVDDDPSGLAMEVCYGMVRARHRNSLDKEELLTPNRVFEFRIRMGITACRFKKGHRIRLEICGSDFPNFDRNHQTGKNDLFDVEMTLASVSVCHSRQYPSSLVVWVQR